MESQTIQVMIVDDHTMVREGMKILLDQFEDIHVAGDVSDGLKAVELARSLLHRGTAANGCPTLPILRRGTVRVAR